MIKVQVIEEFTLARFDELKNIQRRARQEKGKLFVGDIFECTKELADYLIKNNSLGRPFVKVIELIPEEIDKNIKTAGLAKKVEKIEAKKETKKSTTKSKKSVAKK